MKERMSIMRPRIQYTFSASSGTPRPASPDHHSAFSTIECPSKTDTACGGSLHMREHDPRDASGSRRDCRMTDRRSSVASASGRSDRCHHA